MTTPRRALVTGAAREGGIGRAVVRRLVDDGYDVVTLDKEPGCTWRVDVATEEIPDVGPVDVLVANAAITTLFGAAHTFDAARWQLDLDVNLTGTFRVVQRCLPGMRERGHGRIVVVSSTAATHGMPAQVSYATSKAGLLGMRRTVAAENVTTGVTANAVLPGMTASSGILAMPAAIREAWEESMPGGLVDPDDIAHAVAFLADARSGMVTGQTLTVEGGDALNTRSVTSSVLGPRPRRG